jgi:predicted nuclease of predicted toxin-antitoxin system
MAAFFFDNDAADKRVRRALERLGHQTTSAAEQHLADASDRELLHYAGRAGLILVTHNASDFAALYDTEPGARAGIIAIPHIDADGVPALVAAMNELTTAAQPLAGECWRFRPNGWERRTARRGWERA